jgi:uncharacterized protein (TIGR03790 family)
MKTPVVIAAIILSTVGSVHVTAGLGPENVVVVVNADSQSSEQISGEYTRLRKIPDGNVIRLREVPDSETIDVDTFREKLLGPVLSTINERGLTQQIECVAWSSDFPTAINVKSDIGQSRLPKVITPTASLNGLTYFHQLVMKKDLRYLSLKSNGYARQPVTRKRIRLPSADELRLHDDVMLAATQEGKWSEAEEAVHLLLKSNPGNAGMYFNHARCLAKIGQPDDAIVALRKAVKAGWWNSRMAECDDDLAVLHDRSAFDGVLAQMEKQMVAGHVARGFRHQQQWGANGNPIQNGRQSYLMSTVLAVTRGRGLSPDEAIENLRRSVAVDSTYPQGTIYYLRNKNIRSTSRDGLFPSAVSILNAGGIKVRIIDGIVPKDTGDVQGLMVGAAKFDWNSSGSTIQPGAICEHFTSYGGVMRANASQTPLTEFLKFGAAGSSGTVAEPYAIAAKFPDAFIHVRYAAGCCLAESFYQSVTGPYQLLIVGDPLCQPWATPPHIAVNGLTPNQEVSGEVTATPTSTDDVSRFEFYVDGQLRLSCRPGESRQLDSTTLSNGPHEIRIVAVSDTPVETRSRTIIPVQITN